MTPKNKGPTLEMFFGIFPKRINHKTSLVQTIELSKSVNNSILFKTDKTNVTKEKRIHSSIELNKEVHELFPGGIFYMFRGNFHGPLLASY